MTDSGSNTLKSTLPITQVLSNIIAVIESGKNLVLQAEPGAGKSTMVPLTVLQSGLLKQHKILMLEPRRMAAKSIANYLASKLDEPVGQTVGYRVKNDTKVSDKTRLEIITEGVLIRILQNDPELTNVGMVIFDEFHERSLNADLSLMLTKEIQQSIRDDLKLLVMSATIDTDIIANYLGNAEIITCPGRTYPVETNYRKSASNRLYGKEFNTAVIASTKALMDITQGDILVFLPGVGEISQCLEMANEAFQSDEALKEVQCLPLHGSLSLGQQEFALIPNRGGKRKVIFSTNIAETSLTIEGVTGVVDSGIERALTFDPDSGMTRLETQRISKASAEQRKGRAGRLSHGHCIRLWSQSEHQALINYQAEEIINADLSDTVLNLANWGNTDFDTIDWLTKPPTAHFNSAKELLISLGMLSQNGKITSIGKSASQIPVTPRLAKLLLTATNKKQQQIACLLAATLSERDMLIKANSADLSLRIHLLESSLKEVKAIHSDVRVNTIQSIKATASNLSRHFQASNSPSPNLPLMENSADKLPDSIQSQDQILPALLLHAFPERLAKRRDKHSSRYILANGKGASLNDSDPLSRHEWLVVNHCDLRKREGKIFSAIPIDIGLLKTAFSNHLREESKHHFDENTGSFSSVTQLCYRSLIIQQLDKGKPSEEFVSSTCIQRLNKQGKSLLNWTTACEKWLKRLIWLSSVDSEFPALTEQRVFEQTGDWLLPYVGQITQIGSLKKVDILPLLKVMISWEQANQLDQMAPEFYQAPSGKRVPIQYDEAQGPTVSIQLQEMFGETQSPKLANKVNLRFELLSPARRQIQITSDLGQFWVSSYFEVAKEMRAKYPKHRWPDKPLDEKPGKSLKKRN